YVANVRISDWPAGMRIQSGWRPDAFKTSLAVARDGSIEPPGGITWPAWMSVPSILDDSDARMACVDSNVHRIMSRTARFIFPPVAQNPSKTLPTASRSLPRPGNTRTIQAAGVGSKDQNTHFSANCMILGSRALLIWPKM